MPVQKGRDLLVKIDADMSGNYVTIGGLRSRRINFNTALVDVTDADSPGRWRELLGDTAIKRVSIAGSGVFKNATVDAQMRELAFGGQIRNFRIIVPGMGAIDGAFVIASLDYLGNFDGEVTYDLALESAGAVVFTAGQT